MHRTHLHDAHVAAGARMVDFAGWRLPINYGSQLDEHHHVRTSAGMFDVSHMTVVDIQGPDSRKFLSRLLANDVARITKAGQALYSCMLNEKGGVIDDLIAYFLGDDRFRLVVNAATRDKGLAWLEQVGRDFSIAFTEHHESAMIAIQGPQARDKVHAILPPDVVSSLQEARRFNAVYAQGCFVARTGYTGEDGYELMIAGEDAVATWDRLREAGVEPCGLGARDTLRLEAGMNLYGQDMDEDVTPLESGLAWTVAMKDDRDFIGRPALERQKSGGVARKLTGLVLEERGVLRPGQTVLTGQGEGQVTSGTFSPTLQKAIALARIPAEAAGSCQVEIRGKRLTARIVRPPFVRDGKPCEGIL
jgi:aminomethyltransferase